MKENKQTTTSDRDMVERIIKQLKRVEQDYNIDLTKEMEWLRSTQLIGWKPITEIPTKRWANNRAISPLYLVRCGEEDGVPILGYSHYSFATKKWLDCYQATAEGIHKVTAWSDIIFQI